MSATASAPLVLFLVLASAIQLLMFSPGSVDAVEFMISSFNTSNINIKRESVILKQPQGLLRLTHTTSIHAIGHAFYPQPVQMFQSAPTNRTTTQRYVSSFSTQFVFAIAPPASSSSRGGFGMAFTISPLPDFPGAASEHFMGIFNKTNDNKTSNHVFAVEFDTVNGFNDDSDSDGNHVGVNVNSLHSLAIEPATYIKDGETAKEEFKLESGKPVQAWIEYDGDKKEINVTISPVGVTKPSIPLIRHGYDLSTIFLEKMYLGFSASTGNKASSHYVLAWSFSTESANAPALNMSQLPEVPKETASASGSNKHVMKVVLGTLSVVIFLLAVVMFVMLRKKRKWNSHEVLEDWELNCAHRFTYKDLYIATNGFDKNKVIGQGGFGAVYKGVLPKSGVEVAVKKVSGNTVQGMQEFVAEVESLGRLRHKNLVNLQGWCKRKDDLLLIYDYIPNGSLDSFLYKSEKKSKELNWEQRFNILKGIASGLLYLHEEWEQVVIHRDVKSNNVLVDGDMNGRLGDFGLARLSDHGKNFNTTKVVGTIGYIAPEMARTGKASTSSDVFAYGVLVLEVACGRRPIDQGVQPEHLILMDWVIHCQQMGQLLDASDPNLKSSYEVEEMTLVLKLGLLCSHQSPQARPTMRQVVRYLNGDDTLPDIDDWSSHSADSFFSDKMTSRFLELMSSDTSSSFAMSTNGGMSSLSIEMGK